MLNDDYCSKFCWYQVLEFIPFAYTEIFIFHEFCSFVAGSGKNAFLGLTTGREKFYIYNLREVAHIYLTFNVFLAKRLSNDEAGSLSHKWDTLITMFIFL